MEWGRFLFFEDVWTYTLLLLPCPKEGDDEQFSTDETGVISKEQNNFLGKF